MSIGFAVPINCVSLCVGLCICLFGMQRQSEKKLYSRDHTGGERGSTGWSVKATGRAGSCPWDIHLYSNWTAL